MAEKDLVVATIANTRYAEAQIYQANPLIEACKGMDLNEGRLFYLALMELRPQLEIIDNDPAKEKIKEIEPIIIPSADVINLFGGNKSYYRRLKPIAKKLMARSIGIKDDTSNDAQEKFDFINIFRKMEFDRDKGGLIIKFTEDMIPYVLELAGQPYTKIAAKNIFCLGSMYAIRLLELLLQYQNIKKFKQTGIIERRFTIEQLRAYLQIKEGSYKNGAAFRLNVIKKPLEDINKKTAYEANYETIKKGRVIAGFLITLKMPAGGYDSDESKPIKEEIKEAREIKEQKIAADYEYATVDSDAPAYDILRHYKITHLTAKKIAEKYSRERIVSRIKYALAKAQRKKIGNIGGYIVTIISDEKGNYDTYQMSLFQPVAENHKGDGRQLTEAEQRAADKMNAFWYGDKSGAPAEPQNEAETEPVAVKPSPAPEPVISVIPDASDDDNPTVYHSRIEIIKMAVDKGREKAVESHLVELEALFGISIDDVRALSIEELRERILTPKVPKNEPEPEETPVENIQDPEPSATPEPNIFELEIKPEHEAKKAEDKRIYADDYAAALEAIRAKVAKLNKKELQIIKDSVEKDKSAGMMTEMKLKQLDLNAYDAYLVVDEFLQSK